MEQEKDSIFAALRGPEDQEVVIQAGCVPAASAKSGEQEGASIRAGRAPADLPEQRSGANGHEAAVQRGMVTTEEDLKAQVPFSGMRRAILALAAVAVAAAIAYSWIVS